MLKQIILEHKLITIQYTFKMLLLLVVQWYNCCSNSRKHIFKNISFYGVLLNFEVDECKQQALEPSRKSLLDCNNSEKELHVVENVLRFHQVGRCQHFFLRILNISFYKYITIFITPIYPVNVIIDKSV